MIWQSSVLLILIYKKISCASEAKEESVPHTLRTCGKVVFPTPSHKIAGGSPLVIFREIGLDVVAEGITFWRFRLPRGPGLAICL